MNLVAALSGAVTAEDFELGMSPIESSVRDGPTLAELAVHAAVDRMIVAEAQRICRLGCSRAHGDDPCHNCDAGRQRSWRREALASLRAYAAARGMVAA